MIAPQILLPASAILVLGVLAVTFAATGQPGYAMNVASGLLGALVVPGIKAAMSRSAGAAVSDAGS